MKRLIPTLLLGAALLSGLSSPAQADVSGPEFRGRAELLYTPLDVSSSNGSVEGSMQGFTIRGEGIVYQGIIVGVDYTHASSNSLQVGNANFTNNTFDNVNVYTKVPFNVAALADAGRTGEPTPALSPFYGYFGYKNTLLEGQAPVAGSPQTTIQSASGIGFGAGADVRFREAPIGVFGEVVYYPELLAGSGTGTSGFFRVLTYDVGLRAHFGEEVPVGISAGYHGENHDGEGVTVHYNGFRGGIDVEF